MTPRLEEYWDDSLQTEKNTPEKRHYCYYMLKLISHIGLSLIIVSLIIGTASAVTYNGEITDLRLTPSPVYVGSPIYHHVTVQNTGDATLPYIVEVWYGDTKEDGNYDNLYISKGSSQTDIWESSGFSTPGTKKFTYRLYYDAQWPASNVLLDTYTQTVNVVATNTPTPTPTPTKAPVTYSGNIVDVRIAPTPLYTGDMIYHYVTVKNTGSGELPYVVEVWSGSTKLDGNYNNLYLSKGSSDTEVWESSGVSAGTKTFTYKLYYDAPWPDSNALLDTHTQSVSVGAIDAPAPVTTGSLDVGSTPSGASIYIDGTYKGVTPTLVPGVSAGSHQVKITRNGYYDYTKTTAVTAGKTTTVSATLTSFPPTPTTGTLDIRSTPSGAGIYVQGEYFGVTPMVFEGLSEGSYQVKVTKNGYYDDTRRTTVTAGKTTTVSATLTAVPQTPVTGSLDVRSTPSGASVYIDDTYKGVTPKVVSGVSAGPHLVKITRNGYYDYTKTTAVTAGKTTTVSATLTSLPQTSVTGSLDISSTPAGANIYIDGEYKGVTPKVISGLSEGEYWVIVTKDGYVEDNQHKYISAGSTSRVLATLSPVVTSPTEPLPTAIPSGSSNGDISVTWWLLAIAVLLPAAGFIYTRKRQSAQIGRSEVDGIQSAGSPAGHDDGQRRKTATEKVIDTVVVIASFLTCLMFFEMLNQFLGLYLWLPVIAVLTAAVLSMGYFIYSRRNRRSPQDGGSETGGSRSPDSPTGYGTEQAPHPDATTPPGKVDVSVQKSSSTSPKKPDSSVILPDGGSIASTAKPDLAITLSHTSIQADEWDMVGLTLANTGTAPAFDITLTFSNDVETRLLRPVDLAAGASTTIEAGIKPRTKGKVPLEITARYRDTGNRTYKQTISCWLSVEPRSGPVPPGSPVPLSISRPVTPKSLPQEMAERYTASEFIGKGGFARVFKVQKLDGSWAALKIPISLDAATGKSFIAELQNWTSLVHENIVRVNDYNIMPIPYFELELCDGTLATLERPVPPDHAAWLLFNVCEGLKYAHARGILHRDLKPQNIMLRDGVPKISDWGLSKVMTQSRTTTVSGGFTAHYAAPEQITNKPKDERTDIWQLGVILYELVTGTLPFTGESMVEIGMAIATKMPEQPGAVHPDAQPLDTIILKCLEKNPEQRYQSVIDLQKALAAYLKMNYAESLKESVQTNDLQRSAYYCGDLVLISMKIGDLVAAYKYAVELARYSAGEIQAQAVELAKQIKMRVEMGAQELPDELVQKAEVIVHQVRVR